MRRKSNLKTLRWEKSLVEDLHGWTVGRDPTVVENWVKMRLSKAFGFYSVCSRKLLEGSLEQGSGVV